MKISGNRKYRNNSKDIRIQCMLKEVLQIKGEKIKFKRVLGKLDIHQESEGQGGKDIRGTNYQI